MDLLCNAISIQLVIILHISLTGFDTLIAYSTPVQALGHNQSDESNSQKIALPLPDRTTRAVKDKITTLRGGRFLPKSITSPVLAHTNENRRGSR